MADKNNNIIEFKFYDIIGSGTSRQSDGGAARKRDPREMQVPVLVSDTRRALTNEEMYESGLQAIRMIAIGLAVMVLLSVAFVPNLYYRNKINEIGYSISTVKSSIVTAQTRTAKLNNQIRSKFTITSVDEFALENGMIPSTRYSAEYLPVDLENEIVLAENGQ